jgi:hypothetical protein
MLIRVWSSIAVRRVTFHLVYQIASKSYLGFFVCNIASVTLNRMFWEEGHKVKWSESEHLA